MVLDFFVGYLKSAIISFPFLTLCKIGQIKKAFSKVKIAYFTLFGSLLAFLGFTIKSFLQSVKDSTQENLFEHVLQWQQRVRNSQDFEVDKENDDDKVDTRGRCGYEIGFLVQDKHCGGHNRSLGCAKKIIKS